MLDSDLIFGVMASVDKPEFSISDLKYLTHPFTITETNLRTALSRMTGKGLLLKRRSGKQAFYRRSEKGQYIGSNVALRFTRPDWSGWNGLWWGVCFSISEINKDYRYKIRKKLINYHFKPLYSGFWIRPFHSKQNITESLNKDYIKKSARIIKFQPEIEFSKDFICRLWELEDVNQGFEEGRQLVRKHKELSKKSPEQAFISMMEIGGRIVKILFTDPLLPDCYMPVDWQANTLRDDFSRFMKQSKEASKPFWEKIL